MKLLDTIKVRKAISLHNKGDLKAARAEYDALYDAQVLDAGYLLPYTILLLREGGQEEAEKVKEILRKVEKLPGLNQRQKTEIHINYACAQYKLGHLPEAIQLLEASHKHMPCGSTYQTLGYLYVEAGDAEKGLPFNEAAIEYDDEDPIVLDNMGQLYYRVLNDKEKALEYFKKAIEIKDGQIDTLYFLSRYDLENGDTAAAKEKLEKALEGRFSPLNYASREKVQKELDALKGE